MGADPMKSKIVLLGDGGVGKTSLIRRFVVDQYSDDYITTVGTKVFKRSLSLGSRSRCRSGTSWARRDTAASRRPR
jgi:GTPase SAR1 family protein